MQHVVRGVRKAQVFLMAVLVCLLVGLMSGSALADDMALVRNYPELLRGLADTYAESLYIVPDADFKWPAGSTTVKVDKPAYLTGTLNIPSNVTMDYATRYSFGLAKDSKVNVSGTLIMSSGAFNSRPWMCERPSPVCIFRSRFLSSWLAD